MSDMKRQVQKVLASACCIAVAAWLAVGCASVKREPPQSPVSTEASPAATNTETKISAVTHAPPAEGYAWDELARMAAEKSSDAKVLLFEAEAERHKTAVDTGWRNPQLRGGWLSGQENESEVKHSGLHDWSDRDYDGYTTALRVYLTNPFVNRWLRKRGAASAQAIEAQADEVKYAVFCEVKSLCLEAEMLHTEIGLLEQMARLREQMSDVRNEQSLAGVSGTLDLIRAETGLAMLRSEIHAKQTARQHLIRRIAVLAGMPAEQVRLRAPNPDLKMDAAYSTVAVLTDLAFLRRPDLKRALHEKEASEHGLRAARAGQIPWFEYVEGTYDDESGDINKTEENVAGADRGSEDKNEWQARVAVTLPIFNWLGDEVHLNRARLAASEARVQGLYDSIRREIDDVFEDYHNVAAERDRVVAESRQLCEKMTVQIDALASDATVRREDVLAAREELVGYRRVCMKAEFEYLRLIQYLETVSGGSLASAR